MFGSKPKLKKCTFELTYFFTYWPTLKTNRAKVVMYGIKPNVMKCRFELTYFYDLLTYLYSKILSGMVHRGISRRVLRDATYDPGHWTFYFIEGDLA
jgi:hypothetical protein